MKLLEIYVSKEYEFIVCVDNSIIFNESIDNVDVLEITAILCRSYRIPSGEDTLLIYQFLESELLLLKAEKEENILNKRFFSNIA